MKAINIKKCILSFFAYSLIVHPSHAIGLAMGPSLGIAGFHTSFDANQQSQKTSINNLALQIGGGVKLDLWFLYAKLDALFVLDWHKLPNKLDRDYFKYIALPFTIGLPVFNIFRPHIGCVIRLPLDGLDGRKFKGNCLIKSYKATINGYILGLGIDLGNILMDIYWEFARLSVARKSISADLVEGNKHYRPKQLTLRVGYNLLGQ